MTTLLAVRSPLLLIASALICACLLAYGCSEDEKGDFDDIYELCTKRMACYDSIDRWEGMSLCFWMNYEMRRSGQQPTSTGYLQLSAESRCMVEAQSCQEIDDCEQHAGTEAQDALCSERLGEIFCEEGVYIDCYDNQDEGAFVLDCNQMDLECVEAGSFGWCGEGPCNPQTDEPYCKGTQYWYCHDPGFWVSYECHHHWLQSEVVSFGLDEFASASGTCGLDPHEQLACVGDGDVCDTGEYENHCDGDVAVFCRNGKVATEDCKAYGDHWICSADPSRGTQVECIWNEIDCKVLSPNEKCEGSVITFCQLGLWHEIDCAKYGYSGCETVDGEDWTTAYCVN